MNKSAQLSMKLMALTVIATITLLLSSGTSVSAFSGTGDGTVGTPFQITTCEQLQEMNDDKAAYYALANSIDCSGTSSWNAGAGFVPVGTSAAAFTGTLTGNASYTISGLFIQVATVDVGLFGYTTGATISEVHLTGINYTQTSVSAEPMGGLVGTMSGGSISHCSTAGTIRQTTVVSSNFNDYVGGLVGLAFGNGTISHSSSSVALTTAARIYDLGGFAGGIDGTVTITDSFATGNLTLAASASTIGGFIGEQLGNTSITNCYSTGTITTANAYGVGGFVGYMSADEGSSLTTSSYSTSVISITSGTGNVVGGFAGNISNGAQVTNSYATGSLTFTGTGIEAVGGFVGLLDWNWSGPTPLISSSHSTGAILSDSTASAVGGFIGTFDKGAVSTSYSTGNVTIGAVAETSTRIGGFLGRSNEPDTTIHQCYSEGSVITTGNAYNLGGFAGEIAGAVTESSSTGNVSGADTIGGFAGILMDDAQISNSYSRGNAAQTFASAEVTIGGFVGWVQFNAVDIANSYSTGTVTPLEASPSVGGFAGRLSSSAALASSYWDTEASGQATSPAGTGVTTAQLKNSSNLTGWDFSTIWGISPSYNDGYPALKFMLPASSPTVTTTSPATSIATTTATVSGNVSADGGAEITERGVVYSSVNNPPTLSDSKLVVTGRIGALSASLTGLTANTTYYARAYATNSEGTSYGDVVSFTTLTGVPTTLRNVYFTFGKLRYGRYASSYQMRSGDMIYLKNYNPKQVKLLAISLYDYSKKGNQCYTRTWRNSTAMYMRTCGLLPAKRKYAFIFTFQDVATRAVIKKYFVVNNISSSTITY
jgi:hypothetical protein